MILRLPYPPSVNHYWRNVGGRMLISAKGRAYRFEVACMIPHGQRIEGRLAVRIMLHPPDQRRRDLDNVFKALLDALAHAGVYEDDSQIDELAIRRGAVLKGGKAVVQIERIER